MAVDPPGPESRSIPRRPGSAAKASETLRGPSSGPPSDDSTRRGGGARERSSRRTGVQRAVIGLGGVLSALVLLTACTVGYFNWRLGQIDRIDLGLAGAAPGGAENYLIVGSDSRSGISSDDADAGAFLDDPQYQVDPDGSGRRSDTIMIMRIDPSTKAAQLLSFPRDLYVPIAGTDHSDKINAAFGIGVPTLVDTIQDNFRIPI
ncbi:MAG TPA: LCP family protein, partial [Acidimicrobiales bacterium]|nr:LCP family protein [Acidimicrobiales bacterium]